MIISLILIITFSVSVVLSKYFNDDKIKIKEGKIIAKTQLNKQNKQNNKK